MRSKSFYTEKLNINQKINIKSWYGGYLGDLFEVYIEGHLKTFCSAPGILAFCGIATHDCYYGKYKKGARLDGVTSDSIFAATKK